MIQKLRHRLQECEILNGPWWRTTHGGSEQRPHAQIKITIPVKMNSFRIKHFSIASEIIVIDTNQIDNPSNNHSLCSKLIDSKNITPAEKQFKLNIKIKFAPGIANLGNLYMVQRRVNFSGWSHKTLPNGMAVLKQIAPQKIVEGRTASTKHRPPSRTGFYILNKPSLGIVPALTCK